MPQTARRIVLASRPVGEPKASDFRLEECPVPQPGPGQVLLKTKWLSLDPKLLIFDEPTRGIDVGAKAEIYDLMRRLASQGVGVLMISSDMEEILGTSDRVAVMHEGRLTGVLEREECSEETIMRLAVGQANAA